MVVGKGRLVLSQMEATQRYGKDAVVTRLVWNLLEYITGDRLWVAEDKEAGMTDLILK